MWPSSCGRSLMSCRRVRRSGTGHTRLQTIIRAMCVYVCVTVKRARGGPTGGKPPFLARLHYYVKFYFVIVLFGLVLAYFTRTTYHYECNGSATARARVEPVRPSSRRRRRNGDGVVGRVDFFFLVKSENEENHGCARAPLQRTTRRRSAHVPTTIRGGTQRNDNAITTNT